MKRFTGLVVALSLAASPALAGSKMLMGLGKVAASAPPIALVAGTGTGGSLASGFADPGASVVMTTTATCPAGSLIVVTATTSFPTDTLTSVTDTASGGSNTYTLTTAQSYNSTNSYQLAYTRSTNVLPNGATITSTSNNPGSTNMSQASCFSGIAVSPLDVQGTGATATSSAPAYGPTGTLAQANELVIDVSSAASNFTITGSGGYTAQATVGVAFRGMNWMGYKIVNSTAAVSATLTQSGSGAWGNNIYTFKGN